MILIPFARFLLGLQRIEKQQRCSLEYWSLLELKLYHVNILYAGYSKKVTENNETEILKMNFTFFLTFFMLPIHYHREVFKVCLEAFWS